MNNIAILAHPLEIKFRYDNAMLSRSQLLAAQDVPSELKLAWLQSFEPSALTLEDHREIAFLTESLALNADFLQAALADIKVQQNRMKSAPARLAANPVRLFPRPPGPVTPASVPVDGYPEAYYTSHHFAAMYRRLFRASTVIAQLYQCLSAHPNRAASTHFLSRLSCTLELPWPQYDPAKLGLATQEDLRCKSLPYNTFKIEPIFQPEAIDRIRFAASEAAGIGQSWARLDTSLIQPDQQALDTVKIVWKSMLAEPESDQARLHSTQCVDQGLLKLLRAIAGPLDKISEVDRRILAPLYPIMAHQAARSVLPQGILDHILGSDQALVLGTERLAQNVYRDMAMPSSLPRGPRDA